MAAAPAATRVRDSSYIPPTKSLTAYKGYTFIFSQAE
jgi:hypothetical protein